VVHLLQWPEHLVSSLRRVHGPPRNLSRRNAGVCRSTARTTPCPTCEDIIHVCSLESSLFTYTHTLFSHYHSARAHKRIEPGRRVSEAPQLSRDEAQQIFLPYQQLRPRLSWTVSLPGCISPPLHSCTPAPSAFTRRALRPRRPISRALAPSSSPIIHRGRGCPPRKPSLRTLHPRQPLLRMLPRRLIRWARTCPHRYLSSTDVPPPPPSASLFILGPSVPDLRGRGAQSIRHEADGRRHASRRRHLDYARSGHRKWSRKRCTPCSASYFAPWRWPALIGTRTLEPVIAST
jgi:hypothetical protein